MSIVIYHSDEKIDFEQIEMLKSFYGCNNIEMHVHHLETPPEDTLLLLKIESTKLLEHCTLDGTVRVISINDAFAELGRHMSRTIDDIFARQDIYQAKLEQLVKERGPDIFTLEEVLIYLGMDIDKDGTSYAIPSIVKAMESLGFVKEDLTIFNPPLTQKRTIQSLAETVEI